MISGSGKSVGRGLRTSHRQQPALHWPVAGTTGRQTFARLTVLFAVAIWSQHAPPAKAIITADNSGTHTTTPGQGFTRQGSVPLNIDGVVQITTDTQTQSGENIEFLGTGGLIADRYILTAAHVLTIVDPQANVVSQQIDMFGANNKVRFSLPDGDHFVPIAGVSLHPDYYHPFLGYDIAVIELVEDAPGTVPRYPIYTGSNEFGLSVFVKVGYGAAGWGGNITRDADHQKRAGFNAYEANETYWANAFLIMLITPWGM